jgi:NitT/TauT family transport system ATP-binding protein
VTQENQQALAGTLELKEVSKSFTSAGKTVEALRSISVTVQPSEFVVFVGPSGCGKSTLLNLVAGFEPPTSGQILLDGVPVEKPHQDRLMMFQEHGLFPWLNVIRNISYGLRWKYRFQRKLRRERARELIRMVHLEEFEKAWIHELSGGMKQRVALARALAPDPKLLMIDEPFPALDALTRQKLYGDLQAIFTETRKTVLSVTHDTREAACLGDRVVVLTGRPATIRTVIPIELPRPRDINDPRVAEYAGRIMSELESNHA